MHTMHILQGILEYLCSYATNKKNPMEFPLFPSNRIQPPECTLASVSTELLQRGSGSQLEQKTHENTSFSRVPRRNILGFACFARVFWFVSFFKLTRARVDFSTQDVWCSWEPSIIVMRFLGSILGNPFFLDQIGFRSLWIRLFQVWSKVHSLDFETSNQQSWRWNTPIHEEYRWSWSSGNSAAKRLEGRQSHRHLGCHLKKMHISKFNTSCFWSLRFSLCLASLSVPRVCKSEVVQVTSKVTRIPTLYSSFGFLDRFLIATFNLIIFKALASLWTKQHVSNVSNVSNVSSQSSLPVGLAAAPRSRSESDFGGMQLGFFAATLKTSRNLIFTKKTEGTLYGSIRLQPLRNALKSLHFRPASSVKKQTRPCEPNSTRVDLCEFEVLKHTTFLYPGC